MVSCLILHSRSYFTLMTCQIEKINSKYIIPLSLELRKILLEIIEAEGEKLIYDIVHFCIADKHEILVASYDNMDFVQIKKSFYCRFSDHVTNQFAGLEVEIIDFIDDHGFLVK